MISSPYITTPQQSDVPGSSELRDQIRQSILDATRAAREAQHNAQVQAKRTIITTPDGKQVIVESGQPAAPNAPAAPDAPAAIPAIAGTRVVQWQPQVPQGAIDIAYGFFFMVATIIIGWPLARAFGRRIERRGQTAAIDAGTAEQLQRIEQAVDTMAIEVERISESQRFLAKLQSQGQAERLSR